MGGGPKAFPSQEGNIIPAVRSRSARRSPPSLTCLDELQREEPSRLPYQMLQPPQLDPLTMKDSHWLCSIQASVDICICDLYTEIMTIGESRDKDPMGNQDLFTNMVLYHVHSTAEDPTIHLLLPSDVPLTTPQVKSRLDKSTILFSFYSTFCCRSFLML